MNDRSNLLRDLARQANRQKLDIQEGTLAEIGSSLEEKNFLAGESSEVLDLVDYIVRYCSGSAPFGETTSAGNALSLLVRYFTLRRHLHELPDRGNEQNKEVLSRLIFHGAHRLAEEVLRLRAEVAYNLGIEFKDPSAPGEPGGSRVDLSRFSEDPEKLPENLRTSPPAWPPRSPENQEGNQEGNRGGDSGEDPGRSGRGSGGDDPGGGSSGPPLP